MTALAWAAQEGHEQVVDVLLKAGANRDVQGHSCCTALMVASERGHKGIVEALVEGKADTNIADKVGWGLVNTKVQARVIEQCSLE